jgi:hypothetical protein
MRGRACKAQLKGTIKKWKERREDDEKKERKGKERKGEASLFFPSLVKTNESASSFLLEPAPKHKRKPWPFSSHHCPSSRQVPNGKSPQHVKAHYAAIQGMFSFFTKCSFSLFLFFVFCFSLLR